MKQFIVLLLLLLQGQFCTAQISENCGACKDCKNDCGPFETIDSREAITGNKINTAPYNGIMHIGVKRAGNSSRYSTATFIDKDVLLTANHNVMTSKLITSIEFCLVINGKDKWVTLKRKDFEILHYTKWHDKWNDIALIWIKNTSFLKNYPITIFGTGDITTIQPSAETPCHLTGFPCDKPDILMDKTTLAKDLEFDSTNTIISYSKLFTCTGDSGAPLWITKNSKFYIVGIHHGGDDINAFPEKEETNISRKLTPDIQQWIAAKLK